MSETIYAPFNTVTPPLESYFHALVEPEGYKNKNKKYGIGVVMDDSPECKAMIQKLLDFQNACFEKDGQPAQDTLLCMKDEKSKDPDTEKYTTPTGRKLLFFKQATREKFVVVGPNKMPFDPANISKGDIVRANGQFAFGYMDGKPWLTCYMSAVQFISSGGASGAAAFDDETGGEEVPFNDETQPATTPSALSDLK